MTGDLGLEVLRLADDGFVVLPLHGVGARGCTCGRQCPSPGKHSLLADGLHGASADPATVAEWWWQWPAANIGLRTGHGANPVLVVDIDGAQGEDTFKELQRSHGPVAPTRWVRTGGGWHAYFKMPTPGLGTTCRRLGPGLDTRARAGTSLAAPTPGMTRRRRSPRCPAGPTGTSPRARSGPRR